MALSSPAGGKKNKGMQKAQFYVWYLGWKECRGIWGREFVEPITRELIFRRREEELPKLTIEATRKEIKITQLLEKRKGKTEKLKYPPIPTKDATYATQALSPDEDVVSCIYLGYNPQTRAAVHVHVYRCDSPETATFFVEHLNSFIESPENKQRAVKIEQELVAKGQIVPRPTAYVGVARSDAPSTRYTDSDDGMTIPEDPVIPPQPVHDDRRKYGRERLYDRDPMNEYEPDVYDSVTAELKAKLAGRAPSGPLLLPPKDYDTVHRKAGNLIAIESRRSANPNVVGPQALAVDDYSGDSAHSGSDSGSHRHSHADDSGLDFRQNQRNGGGYDRPYNAPANHMHGYDRGQYDDDRGRQNPDPRRFQRPVSPRPRSPEPYNYQEAGRRGRSPNRSAFRENQLARALSPPAGHELRNSYFPSDDMLPNYLAAGSDDKPPSRDRVRSPDRAQRYQGPPDRNFINGGDPGRNRKPKPKYTASNLGLMDQKRLAKPAAALPPYRGSPRAQRPRSDEGYLSMDRTKAGYSGGGLDAPALEGYHDGTDSLDEPGHRRSFPNIPPHRELGDPTSFSEGSRQPFLY